MSRQDGDYASYGWWIHKAANDGAFTASAFVDEKGTVAPATGLNALNGMATYMGGAAGKYALASSTGGTNDAGHFTARATLEADFNANTDRGECYCCRHHWHDRHVHGCGWHAAVTGPSS